MANAREAHVLSRLADIWQLQNYVLDRFNDLREPLGRGDRIIVPNIEALTVYADASVPRLQADRNNPVPTELTLIVNQNPWIPVQVPQVASIENINGNWDSQLADQVMIQFRNYLDGLILDGYLAGQLTWSPAGLATYQINVASVSLIPAHLLTARGLLLRAKGTFARNLMWILDPLAVAAVMGFPGWQNQAIGANQYGADTIGRIYGIDVIESQAVRTNKTVSPTAAVHAANVLTITFATNPGLSVGEPVTTALMTNALGNVSAVPIATVSNDGTIITLPVVTANMGNIWQATTTVQAVSAVNILMDRTFMYTAVQKIPDIRIVPDTDTSGEILQASTLLGYVGRVGRAYAIHSPANTI